MYQRSFLRLLLTPSITSGLVIFLLATVVLGYSSWLYISENQVFYDYLFGAYGLQTFVWQNSLSFSVWTQAFMSSPLAYYLLVAVAAIIIGFAVFTLLQAGGMFFRGTTYLWQEAHYQGRGHAEVMRELVSRLFLRIMALVGWAIYATFFVSTLVPFTIVFNQAGIEAIRNMRPVGALACLGAYVLFLATLHLHHVFMRLTALRPRIFGGDMAIEEAKAAENTHSLDNQQ